MGEDGGQVERKVDFLVSYHSELSLHSMPEEVCAVPSAKDMRVSPLHWVSGQMNALVEVPAERFLLKQLVQWRTGQGCDLVFTACPLLSF